METEWINSAKFKESFLYKMKKEYEFKIRWNERFIKYFVSNLDTFLDKVYVRYGDDDEYKPLLWLAFEYARDYCEQIYLNTPYSVVYKIGSNYEIAMVYGQGSDVFLKKIEE
jgi:hypothetical protein